MNEEIKQIAQRIRALRDINGISMESLAAYVGMKITDYQALESGKTDISVALLIKISQKLNVELAALLTGENPKLHQYCVVRKGHGAHVERIRQYTYESLAYNFIQKKSEPFLVMVNPVSENTKLDFNAHPGQEFNYILDGDMEIYFGDHVIELHEGDSIYFDSSHKHAMKALQGKPVRFLALIM
ncbi:MAG TPA: XRE family transcriptional regulator [Bacteroidales bacterium]|jgi:transcriptional regulator with XRE-family HTH domain|nr:XRE family transcriptional regulator [Bacteroidales bacterium]